MGLTNEHVGSKKPAKIKAYILAQRFTTKGWTETAIMLCKLNKSL